MKTESLADEEKKSFVQLNPLDSSKSLESKKRRSSKENSGQDSPVLKSLFDVKENQQFKLQNSEKKSSGKKTVNKDGPFK